MRTTNAKARQFVQSLQEFRANNLSAKKEGNYYVVYSYGWYPLFAYHVESTKWFENSERYSVSTSKQRTQCHPQQETVLLSHAGMKDLIQGR